MLLIYTFSLVVYIDCGPCFVALVASLHEELVDSCQQIDSQECSAVHAEGNDGEDEDECPAVKRHLCSFYQFVLDMLPDSTPRPDPSGHATCPINLASLD